MSITLSVLILILLLSLILLFVYKISNKVLFNPQIGFTACFLPSTVFLLLFIDKWKVDLSFLTICTIAGGCFLFSLVALCFQSLWAPSSLGTSSYLKRNRLYEDMVYSGSTIRIPICVLIGILTVQGLTLLMIYRFLMHTIGGASLAEAIFRYRYYNTFTDKGIAISGITGLLKLFSYSCGFYFSYVLANNLCYEKSKINIINIFSLMIIIFGMFADLILGSRTGSVNLMFSVLIQLYFIIGKKTKWNYITNKRILFALTVGSIGVLLSFQIVGNFIGRGSSMNFIDYLGMYISAEIKNLDTNIRNGNMMHGMSQSQTLIYLYKFLAGKLNIPSLNYDLDLPFYSVGKYKLGNVCTVFFPFIYDAGFFGFIIFTIIMAIISQYIFTKCYKYRRCDRVNIWCVIYSYLYFNLLFSFFSNKFYENIFNYGFFKFIVFWLCIKIVSENIPRWLKKGVGQEYK